MQIKGKWAKSTNIVGTGDPGFSRNQYPNAFARTDAIAAIIKNIYPQPVGLEAIHHASVGGWPACKRCPAAYSFWSNYKSYYFNRYLNKILLQTETRTAVRVHFNDFGLYFFTKDTATLTIDGEPTKVFSPLNPDGEWKGLPLYKIQDWLPGNREKSITKIVLLTKNGWLPFIPLTQKQYLQGLKIFWWNEKQKVVQRNTKAEKEQLKIIEETRNNKSLDAPTKDKLLAALQKSFDSYLESRDADAKKLTSQFDKKIEVIDQYLSSHSENEMQRSVVTTSFMDFSGYFGDSKTQKGLTPVRIDPSYFNTNLPRHVPQFIVMEWNAEDDAPGKNFRKIFEEQFPVQQLQAMIDQTDRYNPRKILIAKTDPVNDPELKAIRKKAEKYADSMSRFSKDIPGLAAMAGFMQKPQPDTAFNYEIPAKNQKWLSALPNKKLSATELKAFIDGIEKKYTALLVSSGIKLPDASSLDAGSASYSSSMLLLNGMSEQAAWMAIKAVQKAPGNILVLNNSGAVLNACGFQPVAVPVLETALEKSPGNSNIQNNLGQSYIALGDIETAARHLQQSVSSNPYHPHANLTLAYIHYSKSDKNNALKYVENSLYGSFSNGAMRLLLKLKPDARLIKYLKDRYKPTDYFNENKYKLPAQCEKVSEIAVLKGEYTAFREMVERVKNKYDAIAKEEYAQAANSMRAKIANYKTSGIMQAPFTELAYLMIWDRVYLRLHDGKDRLARAQHIYQKCISELNAAYQATLSATEDCEERIALSNRYMALMAFVTREYQNEWMPLWKEVLNDWIFWNAFAYPDKQVQRGIHAGVVSSFLGEVLRMAETHFLDPGTTDCANTDEIKKGAEDYKMPDPHCPIDVGIEFGIGSFSLDCEKIEYHFGGLLVADVVHSFRNHRTTIAIGAGLDLKFGGEKLKAGPIQGGFTAKGKMQYFLTFDGTHPSDQGIIWDAAIKYKQKLKTGIEGIEKLEEIETTNVDASAKVVLSVHNGWSQEGSVFKYLDKILEANPEVQKNKNVKIFQQ